MKRAHALLALALAACLWAPGAAGRGLEAGRSLVPSAGAGVQARPVPPTGSERAQGQGTVLGSCGHAGKQLCGGRHPASRVVQ